MSARLAIKFRACLAHNTKRRNCVTETREFPTEVIASLSSGILVCKFSDMHEAAEYLMGHPIWTHHFGDKALWQSMREAILVQHPNMPLDLDGVTPGNWEARRDALHAELGGTVTIQKGDGHTALSPLDGIPEGKPTILLSV